jgi:hypothetical protein
MRGVVVFGLNGIFVAIQSDIRGIERNRDKGGVEFEEAAFISNLLRKDAVVQDV